MVVAIAATAVAVGASAYSASQQSKAAKDAARTQADAADEATALQREMYYQSREDIAPWRQAGLRALPQLERMLARGPGDPFRAPAPLNPSDYRFTPPTPESIRNDPAYQWRLAEGQRALEGSAASRGGLLSGGTLRGLTDLGQNMASQEYQNIYGRALGENQLQYGRALTGNEAQYQRALQQWQLRQGLNETQYNRLAGLAGVGQTTSQYLGGLGSAYAQNAGEIALQRGNALAAGQIGSANAWGNFYSSLGSTAGSLGGMYMGGGMRGLAPSPQQVGYNPSSVPYDPWSF